MAFTPSIVPQDDDTVYLVEDDYGRIGRCWRETEASEADRSTTIDYLYRGEFNDPVRVVAFNIREGWARDVSSEIAAELQRRADLAGEELTGSAARFVADHASSRQLALRLVQR